MNSAELTIALRVFPDEDYIDPMVRHLEEQRKLYTANLGLDMGKDWYGAKGSKFRLDALRYYVGMFLQATITRQFQMAARQVKGMIQLADENSGMASLEPIQINKVSEDEAKETVERVPAIYMELMREQAKERREKAKRLSNRNPRRYSERDGGSN